jgi:diacylglycerol kinase
MNRMNVFVLENRRMTMHEVANKFELSFGSVQSMLKDNMNMREHCYQICALYVLSVHEFMAKNNMIFIPHNLTSFSFQNS